MNAQEIKDSMNSLIDQALTKGVSRPRFEFQITSGAASFSIYALYYNDQNCALTEFLFGETPADAILAAKKWVAQIPDRATRQRNEYREAVAHAIDLGNKYQIEDAAINPLREVMEKLSKNVLEHKPA